MKALNINPDNLWEKMLIATGSISIIELDDGLIRVNAINLIDHSPLKEDFYQKKVSTNYHP